MSRPEQTASANRNEAAAKVATLHLVRTVAPVNFSGTTEPQPVVNSFTMPVPTKIFETPLTKLQWQELHRPMSHNTAWHAGTLDRVLDATEAYANGDMQKVGPVRHKEPEDHIVLAVN